MTSSSSAGSGSGLSLADTFFAACGAEPEPDRDRGPRHLPELTALMSGWYGFDISGRVNYFRSLRFSHRDLPPTRCRRLGDNP
jgi:hypothetical protein